MFVYILTAAENIRRAEPSEVHENNAPFLSLEAAQAAAQQAAQDDWEGVAEDGEELAPLDWKIDPDGGGRDVTGRVVTQAWQAYCPEFETLYYIRRFEVFKD